MRGVQARIEGGRAIQLDLDLTMAFLGAVARHLEAGVGGRRFPALFLIAYALMDEERHWGDGDVWEVADALRAIRTELESVPASATASFVFNEEEGYPDIYAFEGKHFTGTAAQRFGGLVDALEALLREAQAAKRGVQLTCVGPRVEWWDRPS